LPAQEELGPYPIANVRCSWTAAGGGEASAATLGLSERTVENHLRRIRKRLGVATTAQAIRVAIRNGEIVA
jgi:DNA-binding CsgD family transcriptional regulator